MSDIRGDWYLLEVLRKTTLADVPDAHWEIICKQVVDAEGIVNLSGQARQIVFDGVEKAKSFGGDRSAAGRYAANMRWMNQGGRKGPEYITADKMPRGRYAPIGRARTRAPRPSDYKLMGSETSQDAGGKFPPPISPEQRKKLREEMRARADAAPANSYERGKWEDYIRWGDEFDAKERAMREELKGGGKGGTKTDPDSMADRLNDPSYKGDWINLPVPDWARERYPDRGGEGQSKFPKWVADPDVTNAVRVPKGANRSEWFKSPEGKKATDAARRKHFKRMESDPSYRKKYLEEEEWVANVQSNP